MSDIPHIGGGGLFLLLLALGGNPSMADAQVPSSPTRPKLPLILLPDTLAICRLAADAAIPNWAAGPGTFLTVSRTAEELSITTVQGTVPDGAHCERNYRAFKVQGPLPLNLVGVLASIASPLAEAGLSIFAISTFDTDYVLVKTDVLESAIAALKRVGHTVNRPSR
jgi:hypothetical protein